MSKPGVLYVVATPIGNLDDISRRALLTLAEVDLIAAEDTRHSQKLLAHFSITTPMLSLHEHNEEKRLEQIISMLQQGQSIALISDAGTPLINDPGYNLVRTVQHEGFRVSPIPGPCAAIAAVSAAGLPSDKFSFEGFLPAKQTARIARLQQLQHQPQTMVFYEAPHRIIDVLTDMVNVFGYARPVCLARELTKTYETVFTGVFSELIQLLTDQPEQQRGEIVLVVQGNKDALEPDQQEASRIMQILSAELPKSQAASLCAKITGLSKKDLYHL